MSTYWVGCYLEAVDGGPEQSSGGLTLPRARALERRWENHHAGAFARVLREDRAGQLHELRTFRSRLPGSIAKSLAAQGLSPVI